MSIKNVLVGVPLLERQCEELHCPNSLVKQS